MVFLKFALYFSSWNLHRTILIWLESSLWRLLHCFWTSIGACDGWKRNADWRCIQNAASI